MPQRLLRSKRNKLRFANTPNKRDHFTQDTQGVMVFSTNTRATPFGPDKDQNWLLYWPAERDPPPGTRYLVRMESLSHMTKYSLNLNYLAQASKTTQDKGTPHHDGLGYKWWIVEHEDNANNKISGTGFRQQITFTDEDIERNPGHISDPSAWDPVGVGNFTWSTEAANLENSLLSHLRWRIYIIKEDNEIKKNANGTDYFIEINNKPYIRNKDKIDNDDKYVGTKASDILLKGDFIRTDDSRYDDKGWKYREGDKWGSVTIQDAMDSYSQRWTGNTQSGVPTEGSPPVQVMDHKGMWKRFKEDDLDGLKSNGLKWTPTVDDVWKIRIGNSGQIANCADINKARDIMGLGSDIGCPLENFTQRPDNFPQSSKVDKFSQDWKSLLDKFDEELSGAGSRIPQYGSDRDILLNEILEAVKKGDYRGVQLIKNMSDALYDAAESIDEKVTTLAGIKQQFNDLNNNALNKINISMKL